VVVGSVALRRLHLDRLHGSHQHCARPAVRPRYPNQTPDEREHERMVVGLIALAWLIGLLMGSVL
jgi:hypothetical protein